MVLVGVEVNPSAALLPLLVEVEVEMKCCAHIGFWLVFV
jgi:hypothetical protein